MSGKETLNGSHQIVKYNPDIELELKKNDKGLNWTIMK